MSADKPTNLYILDGRVPKEVGIDEWIKWMRDFNKRIIKQTQVVTPSEVVLVSTVFLGVNHAWGGGPPILFETMVFGGIHNNNTRRYHTWDDAERGHAEILGLCEKESIHVKEPLKKGA